MTSLKQIRKAKKQKVGIPLTDKEQDQCVIEWLKQKLQTIDEESYFVDIKELLEELEK